MTKKQLEKEHIGESVMVSILKKVTFRPGVGWGSCCWDGRTVRATKPSYAADTRPGASREELCLRFGAIREEAS